MMAPDHDQGCVVRQRTGCDYSCRTRDCSGAFLINYCETPANIIRIVEKRIVRPKLRYISNNFVATMWQTYIGRTYKISEAIATYHQTENLARRNNRFNHEIQKFWVVVCQF